MILANVILIWTGTNASIPAGWTRETSLDNRYPKAWGTQNPNVTGGSNTHTHTGSHSHTMVAHSHSCSYDYSGDFAGENNTNPINASSHTHSSSSLPYLSGGGLASQTVTWSSVNHEPPYYTVIFIKPSGAQASIASGITAHYHGSSVPSGWYYCNGSNGTPDLRNKYLKGANTGANAGSTGGSTSHVHSISHTHSVNNHNHRGNTGAVNNDHGGRNPGGSTAIASRAHIHQVTLSNSHGGINSYTNTSAGGGTVEISYKKVGILKNNGGAFVTGMIGMWLGSTGSIPDGWNLCDGNNGTYDMRDRFIKIGSSLSDNNNTGGSNTHSHSNVSHTHTATGTHIHTASFGNASSCGTHGVGSEGVVLCAHSHPTTVTPVTSTFNNANVSANSVGNQPAYRTVAYIQYFFINTSRTCTSKANLRETIIKTIQAKANIKKQTTKNLTAKGRVQHTRAKTLTAKSRIGTFLTQTINAKANIFATTFRSVQVKAATQRSFTQSISSKGRIEKQFSQSIQSKANLLITTTQTINAKGNIKSTLIKTIEAIGEIVATLTRTIQSKGSIKREFSQTIQSKANLFITSTQTITAKGSIKKIGTEGLLQAKASILRTFTYTIQAKANIYNPLVPPEAFRDEIAKTVRQLSPKVEMQWDGATWVDESDYFISASANEKLAKMSGEGIAATLDIELDNTTERFTPGNALSPIYQYLVPRVAIRVYVTAGGFDYRIFTGYIKNIHPDTRSRVCNLECFDNQVLVYNQRANGIVYEDKRSDELLTTLVGLAGLTSGQYSFDVGEETINFGYFEDRNVWPIMGEIAVAERGRVFFNRHGILNFWNRSKLHNQSARAIIPNITLDSWISDLDYSVAEHEIKNVVIVKAKPRANAGVQVVWSSGNVEYLNPYTDTLVLIPANGVQVAWIELEDPCTTFITPVQNTDFTANSTQDGSGDDLTANITIHEFVNYGNAVFINVINTGATDAYLTKFQVRGNPVRVLKWIKVTAKEDSSISRYGRQEFEIENNFIDSEDVATAIAQEELWRRKEAINLFRINIIGIPHLLCGDVINIEHNSGNYKNYMIDELNWTFDNGGFRQRLTLVNPYIFPSIKTVDARGYIV